MRSFRVSEHLEEMIKQECKRRNTDFSSFMRAAALPAGTKFGRPRKLSDYQRQEAIKRRADGETLAAISKSYGVSIAMISRL